MKKLKPTDRFDAERLAQLAKWVDNEERCGMRAKMEDAREQVREYFSMDKPIKRHVEPRDFQGLYTRNRTAEQLLRGLIRVLLSEDVKTNGNPYRFEELTEALRFLTGHKFGDA